MRNEDAHLGRNEIPILVASQCYWMHKFREFLRLANLLESESDNGVLKRWTYKLWWMSANLLESETENGVLKRILELVTNQFTTKVQFVHFQTENLQK